MRPYTLTTLKITKNEIRKNCTSTTKQRPRPHHPPKGPAQSCAHTILLLDARNHYPQIKHHTPPPKRSDNTPHPHRVQHHPRFPKQRDEEVTGLLSQSPIVCPAASPERPKDCLLHAPGRRPLQVPATDLPSTLIPQTRGWGN